MRMTRTGRSNGYSILVAMMAVVLLAACGGGDNNPNDADTTAAASATTTSGSTVTAAPDQTATTQVQAAEEPSDVQRASVTLNGETYETDLAAQGAICVSMGGAVAGSGPIAGVDSGSMSLDIPPEDYENDSIEWDAPSIRLDLGEDAEGRPIDWRAGGEIIADFPDLAGKSQVDSFTNDGVTATGTATFIDFFQVQLFNAGQVEEPQPVQGTFEIECN